MLTPSFVTIVTSVGSSSFFLPFVCGRGCALGGVGCGAALGTPAGAPGVPLGGKPLGANPGGAFATGGATAPGPFFGAWPNDTPQEKTIAPTLARQTGIRLETRQKRQQTIMSPAAMPARC